MSTTATPTPSATPARLLAYTNCQYTKEQAVALMQEHRRLDQIIQGSYGQTWGEKFKGCLVGCATRGDHHAFEAAFGIPKILAVLADRVFESCDAKRAPAFAVEFFEAIQPGADLSCVYANFAAKVLRAVLLKVNQTGPEVDAIFLIASLFEKEASGETVKPETWAEARARARARARALDLDLSHAHVLSRARALDLALSLARDLALSLALSLARDLARNLDLALSLARDLARDLAPILLAALSSASAADTVIKPAALADDSQAIA